MSAEKIILDLCGGSGAWSRPYREAGHKTLVITLPTYNVMRITYADDAVLFFRDDCGFTAVKYDEIAGILAAPPCTEFSVAKGGRPRDLAGAMKIVEACMQIIWAVQSHTKLDFWALENPRGLLRRFLGKPAYTFEQWQFGGDKLKATDIWGYFNIPSPKVKEKPAELAGKSADERAHAREWTKCEYPPEYEGYIKQFHGDDRRAASRAITPAGFADAFYRANKPN
jgi:hypothetical protein